MRIPSGENYFDVRDLVHGLEAAHGVRVGVVPQHRRVLGPARAHHHDPRRHLHAQLPVLRRADGPARCRSMPTSRAAWREALVEARAAPHRHHLGRSRRHARRRRGALGGDDPRRSRRACPEMTLEVLTGDFKGDTADVDTVLARAARCVRAQPGDGAAAVQAGARAGALRPQLRRARACAQAARRGGQDRPHARARRGARRGARGAARARPARLHIVTLGAVSAAVDEPSAAGALRDAGRVRAAQGGGAGARASPTSRRARSCAARITPTGRPAS